MVINVEGKHWDTVEALKYWAQQVRNDRDCGGDSNGDGGGVDSGSGGSTHSDGQEE